MARHAGDIIFTSDFERRAFLTRHPEHEEISRVIPIGSNIDLPADGDTTERDAASVVYFGLIRPEKGIEDFIDLVKLSTGQGRRFRFRIVGTPHPNQISYYKGLREETARLPIQWDVGCPADEVAQILRGSTFAYLPFPDGASDRRGSLLAVLGNGLATVTTSGTQTPPELAQAVSFASSPAEALRELDGLSNSPFEKSSKVESAVRFARARSWDDIAASHLSEYERMRYIKPDTSTVGVRCSHLREPRVKSGMQSEDRFHPERASTLLRFSDKYLGIPIAFLIGLMKKKANVPENLERIALLKTAAIGDTILTSAVIRDIRDRYPKSEIVMFAGSSNIEAAEMLEGLNKVIELPIRNPFASGRLIRSEGEFDALIEFGPWPRIDAILTSFARAKYKIGFKTKGQFRHYVYSVAVPHSSYTHEVFNFKKLLRPLGISGANLPNISIEGEFEDSNYVVVHMFPGGSRSYLKEWGEDNWIALVGSLARLGLKVYLTGAKSDGKRAMRIKDEVGSEKVVVTAGMFSLRGTALLLKSSKLVISVDTGVMHLASALGCNLIALHGPSSPWRWGPLSDNATVFYRNRIGPCIDLGFESRCGINRCMNEITVEEVMEKTRSLVGMHEGRDSEGPCRTSDKDAEKFEGHF